MIKQISKLKHVHVYGGSLEAITIATGVSRTVDVVHTNLSDRPDWGEHLSSISSEPNLMNLYELATNKEKITLNNSIESDASVHWLIYKGSDIHQLIDLINQIILINDVKAIILTTYMGIGLHAAIKEHLKQASEKNPQLLNVSLIIIPVFFREGSATIDFFKPSNLLIGVEDNLDIALVSQILPESLEQADKVFIMDGPSVELANTAVAAYLAMRLSFINELANISETLSIDFEQVITAMSSDNRFGDSYNKPGCGFGGVALQSSVENLMHINRSKSETFHMMRATLNINESQKDLLFRKFWRYFQANVQEKKVAIWGGAFRANTSSISNSPATTLIDALLAEDVKINIYDPLALNMLEEKYQAVKNFHISKDKYSCLENCDCLFIVTDWDEFEDVDFSMLKKQLNLPVVFDGRNLFDEGAMVELGIEYYGVGKGVKWC